MSKGEKLKYNGWIITKLESTIYIIKGCTIRFSSIECAKGWING